MHDVVAAKSIGGQENGAVAALHEGQVLKVVPRYNFTGPIGERRRDD